MVNHLRCLLHAGGLAQVCPRDVPANPFPSTASGGHLCAMATIGLDGSGRGPDGPGRTFFDPGRGPVGLGRGS